MGKVRHQRRSRNKKKVPPETSNSTAQASSGSSGTHELLIPPQENLFAGLNINVDSLSKNLSDDVKSVKSLKSVKSESEKLLSKKDKLKLRRELLLKKFEVLNQHKTLKKKRKKDVVGDLDPLLEALPVLDSLQKSQSNVPYKAKSQTKKKRGIEKAKVLKKSHVQGVKIFQQILKNKTFLKDPKSTISQNVQAMLKQEQGKSG